MKKLLFILAIIGLTSCSVTKHNHRKDPVQSAVENTMKELKNKGIIN